MMLALHSVIPFVNLVLILALFVLVGFVSIRVLRNAQQWTIPVQDAKLTAQKTGLDTVRTEVAGLRGSINRHETLINGHSFELKTIRQRHDFLEERVTGIGEEQARMLNEHAKNHPVEWKGERDA